MRSGLVDDIGIVIGGGVYKQLEPATNGSVHWSLTKTGLKIDRGAISTNGSVAVAASVAADLVTPRDGAVATLCVWSSNGNIRGSAHVLRTGGTVYILVENDPANSFTLANNAGAIQLTNNTAGAETVDWTLLYSPLCELKR